ncbi:dUTP diphosphatase [Nocardia sp. FBN12]|uniref:dUTP diphosphatase n=1 Tax=Nocardia sp. FBN12 TaxID=3419766 RepID=UPI003D08B734
MIIPLRIPYIQLDPELPRPRRAHTGDAGIDLHGVDDVLLAPGGRALIGTGIAIALPLGTVGLIHPRSGLAAQSGVTVLNTPGTVDSGYRGEIKVCLINHGEETVMIKRGNRIAQLLVQTVELPELVEVDQLDETIRGADGFGSTGSGREIAA